MKGVQCYELIVGIALKNLAFLSSMYSCKILLDTHVNNEFKILSKMNVLRLFVVCTVKCSTIQQTRYHMRHCHFHNYVVS